MPPPSRNGQSESRTRNVPPTLGPFLHDLPSSSSTISNQQTPTGPLPNGLTLRSPPSSPTRHRNETNEQPPGARNTTYHDDDDVTLDDTDFQSHYSRQSSPASSSSGAGSASEDDGHNGVLHPTSPST